MASNKPRAYSKVQIGLHWLIALLIGVNYLFGENIGDSFEAVMKGEPVDSWAASLHVWVGMTVLALAAVRLVVRLVQGVPEAIASGKPLMDRAAEMAHRALYGLMILVPALGALAWFGAVGFAGGAHVLTMNLMMLIAFVHAAAAIFHQYVLRDGLLTRMTRGI